MWILISGNPVDGFNFYGPFESSEDAVEWASREIFDEWWPTMLITPTSGGQSNDRTA